MVRRSALMVGLYGVLALGAVLAALASGWYLFQPKPPTILSVAVGGQGGNIDRLMSEVGDLVASHSETIRLSLVHTDGSATNARMVAAGEVMLASVQADILTASNVRTVWPAPIRWPGSNLMHGWLAGDV